MVDFNWTLKAKINPHIAGRICTVPFWKDDAKNEKQALVMVKVRAVAVRVLVVAHRTTPSLLESLDPSLIAAARLRHNVGHNGG